MKKIYKRMLQKMEEKAVKSRKRREPWTVYILKCGDGTFYTGIAKDLQKRFEAHSSGKGAKYTRTRLPLEILYQESCKDRARALVRECAVKALPRKKKEILVQQGKTVY